jgi:hypothetical protein
MSGRPGANVASSGRRCTAGRPEPSLLGQPAHSWKGGGQEPSLSVGVHAELASSTRGRRAPLGLQPLPRVRDRLRHWPAAQTLGVSRRDVPAVETGQVTRRWSPDRQLSPSRNTDGLDVLRRQPHQIRVATRHVVAGVQKVRRSPIVAWPGLPTALYVPPSARSEASNIQSARSRASMY